MHAEALLIHLVLTIGCGCDRLETPRCTLQAGTSAALSPSSCLTVSFPQPAARTRSYGAALTAQLCQAVRALCGCWLTVEFVRWGRCETIQALLEAGASIGACDADGDFPLHHAARNNKVANSAALPPLNNCTTHSESLACDLRLNRTSDLVQKNHVRLTTESRVRFVKALRFPQIHDCM